MQKNRVATQEGCLQGKLSGWGDVAPIKSQGISSDSPACKNIAWKNVRVAPVHMQEPVAVSNRFSPLYKVDDFGQEINVDDTMHDIL